GQLYSTALTFGPAAQAAGLCVVAETPEAPLPLNLQLVHPRFALPKLANASGFARAARAFDRLSRFLVPTNWWSYVVLEFAPRP
ncbi:MAG TPA: hypothetical protein VGW38_03125, partial [Chloroflexota bacterium]|nr:hypothetical protein [Chloroflexota bacterium]